MNSENLQKLFAKEYEDFFSKNNLIVSCPHIINRGNVTHLEGIKVRIAQKLPTKIYIGINIRKDTKIKLQTATRFLHSEQRFETKEVSMLLDKTVIENIERHIQEHLLTKGYNQGIDIYILSENEKDTGTATYGAASLLLGLAIDIIIEKISPEQLNNYTEFIHSKEFKNLYTTVKETAQKAWGISKEGLNTTVLFMTAIHNGNIGIGLQSKEYLQEVYPEATKFDNNLCLEHIGLEPKKIIEYSIINFGGFFSEFYNTETYKQQQEEYNTILQHYKMFQKTTTAHIDMLNILYLETFKIAKEAIIHPNDEHLTYNFFSCINRIGSYETFIEKHMDLYRDIISTFKESKHFKDEKIGLIPISSAKQGGTFLCLTKPEKSRETLEKMMSKLHQIGYSKANFQYLSWEDGMGRDGLKIEQYIDKKIYSSYIQENTCILEQCCSNEQRIGQHESLHKNLPEGIVFDSINKKIYIAKQPITHEDLYTQSGTIEIMEKVCYENQQQKPTNNKELPASSYSKNKNEMIGKIIVPLQKLVEKAYKKPLNISCSGSITDFTINFEEKTIPIYFINKMTQKKF